MPLAIPGFQTRLKVQPTRLETPMSFFDSPLARCEAVREMVLTDETQSECAREHNCPPGFKCPLCGYFTENSGISEEGSRETLNATHPAAH